MSTIEIRGLSKSYRAWWRRESVPAVRGIDLEVRQGEIFGFLGANGAGKTTTIKMMLGFLFPDSGTIRIFGRAVPDLEIQRRIGYQPELPVLPEYLRLEEMLRLFGRLSGLDRPSLERRIDEVLKLVDMQDARTRVIETFSKGMVQRASLAQALLADPELLLLDEPASGLDPIGRRSLRELLVRLKGEGKTIFLNSHELEVVQLVCDRYAIIHHGRIVSAESIASLTEGARYQIGLERWSGGLLEELLPLGVGPDWNEAEQCLAVACADLEALNAVLDAARRRGCLIRSVGSVSVSLEERFLARITSRS